MKILLLNDYATATGGAELITLALRDGLRERGVDARLLTTCARPIDGESTADYECFGTTSRLRTLLQSANPWAYFRLRQVLAEFRPDVVHVNLLLTQLSPLILPLLRNVPSLYHAHWYRSVCPLLSKTLPDGTECQAQPGTACYRNHCLPLHDGVPLAVQAWLWRRWRQVFDITIANSAEIRRLLIADGLDPVEVVAPGIRHRPMRGPLGAPPTVVFTGRLDHQKGADVLARAMKTVVASIPQARLLIAGEGPDRAKLTKMISDLGLQSHISMLGHLTPQEVNRVSATAWVQAVPSRFAEAFGLAAAEAMMRGTAVVASTCGGLSEVVQDGQTGILVAPDDASALADVLIQILHDRERAERMGRAGHEFAIKHFRQEDYFDQIIALYERLTQTERFSHVY